MSAAELLIQPTTVTDLVNSSTKDSGEDDGGGGDDGQETKHKNLVWLEDGFQYYVISLGKLAKQIFGKSWEFGPTGLTPPPSPYVGISKKEKKD